MSAATLQWAEDEALTRRGCGVPVSDGRAPTCITVEWVPVNLPWRVAAPPEVVQARDRVAKKYAAALAEFDRTHPFSAGCLRRGQELTYDRMESLAPYDWLWRWPRETAEEFNGRVMAGLWGLLGSPHCHDAQTLGAYRVAAAVRAEYLDGPGGAALRAAEDDERRALEAWRGAQFATHPLNQPHTLVEVRWGDGNLTRHLAGSGGVDLDGVANDEDVITRVADLSGLLRTGGE